MPWKVDESLRAADELALAAMASPEEPRTLPLQVDELLMWHARFLMGPAGYRHSGDAALADHWVRVDGIPFATSCLARTPSLAPFDEGSGFVVRPGRSMSDISHPRMWLRLREHLSSCADDVHAAALAIAEGEFVAALTPTMIGMASRFPASASSA